MLGSSSQLKRERRGPVKIADCHGEWRASDGARIMVKGDSVQRQPPGINSAFSCTAPLKEGSGTVQWDSWQIVGKSPEKITWKHSNSGQEVFWKKIDSAKQSAADDSSESPPRKMPRLGRMVSDASNHDMMQIINDVSDVGAMSVASSRATSSVSNAWNAQQTRVTYANGAVVPDATARMIEPGDLDAEWEGSDGARIKVSRRRVVRDSVTSETRITKITGGGVKWGNWQVISVPKHKKELVWYCPGQQLVRWKRTTPRQPRQCVPNKSSYKPAIYTTDKELGAIQKLIRTRLPKLSPNLVRDEGVVNIALHDGNSPPTLVAAATMREHPSQDFSEVIYFVSKETGKGYGSTLMYYMKQHLQDGNLNSMILYAGNDAVGFFEDMKYEVYDSKLHVSETVWAPRMFKPDNATLMIWDCTFEDEFTSDCQEHVAKQFKINDEVEVRYGHHKEIWAKGVIQSIDHCKIHVNFKKKRPNEWIVVTSPRLKCSKRRIEKFHREQRIKERDAENAETSDSSERPIVSRKGGAKTSSMSSSTSGIR